MLQKLPSVVLENHMGTFFFKDKPRKVVPLTYSWGRAFHLVHPELPQLKRQKVCLSHQSAESHQSISRKNPTGLEVPDIPNP